MPKLFALRPLVSFDQGVPDPEKYYRSAFMDGINESVLVIRSRSKACHGSASVLTQEITRLPMDTGTPGGLPKNQRPLDLRKWSSLGSV